MPVLKIFALLYEKGVFLLQIFALKSANIML